MEEKPVKLTRDDPVWRRYGRNHEKPCADPRVLTCALSECQRGDRCKKFGRAHPAVTTV